MPFLLLMLSGRPVPPIRNALARSIESVVETSLGVREDLQPDVCYMHNHSSI